MIDQNVFQDDITPEDPTGVEAVSLPPPMPVAPPIQSRFLFVDVAALRAKQLRRGALPRLKTAADAATARPDLPHKAERVAMEEVRQGFISYDLPDAKPSEGVGAEAEAQS